MNRLSKWTFLGLCLAFTTQHCKTSGDIARGSEYVDPTEVRTVENGDAPVSVKSSTPTSDLARENAVLRGQVEELEYQRSQEQAAFEKRIQALEESNQKLIESIGISAPISTVPTEGEDSNSRGAVVRREPIGESDASLWKESGTLLKAGNMRSAVVPLKKLIRNYEKSQFHLGAIINLGAAYYGLGRFSDAALTFNQAIEKHPKNSATALAWFGQAAAFSMMKQHGDSKLIFEELIRRFPTTGEAKRAIRINKKQEAPPKELISLVQKRPSIKAF